MKTLEFEAEVVEHEMLKLPDEIARQFVTGDKVRIVLIANESSDWRQLVAQQFLEGYDAEDAIYDDL